MQDQQNFSEDTERRSSSAVTIYRSGTLSLNRSAYVALGSPPAVELLFDRQYRRIGLRSIDARRPHAYPVRSATGRDSGPFVVSALAFLRFYDLQLDVSRRWSAAVADGVLIIELDGPAAIVTSVVLSDSA